MRPFSTTVLAALTLALTSACAGPGGGASSPSRPLPPYAGDVVDLFDDAIDSHAVGLELEVRSDPRSDPKTRARAQASDEVVRGRITTVTGEVEGPDKAYLVGFHSLEHLAGKNGALVGGDEVTVHIDKNSPAMGILKSFEGRLVGKTFVLYAKAFRRVDGDRDVHFHADPDAPDVIAAVKEAVVLDEVK